MKASLQTRVAALTTLVIVLISVISTSLFIFAFSSSKEKGLVARGAALSYSLSKAAEEGLVHENLDLIKKASYIIRTPDVALLQVYSDLWEPIDAYPFTQLKDPPSPEALRHFKEGTSPTEIKTSGGYEFYSPIIFRASEESPPITIGFVRIILSSATIQRELRRIVTTNVTVSVVITLFAILSINLLISRHVIRPVTSLYKSMSKFRSGILPTEDAVIERSAEEIRELSGEFIGMCRTIKEKEDRLVESDRRIRSLFERVEHAIFRLDREGTVVEANGRFREMFGDVTGLCEILTGRTEAADCIREAISGNGLHLEDKALGRKGEELIVSISLYPVMDEGGEISAFEGYIIDITEKKRLEERLMRAQKMEAVGTLAGGMAHDFNNLLTAILGYSEIMLDRIEEGDPLHRPATIIYEAAKRGADFGKKILMITRREKVESKPVDINMIVRNSIDLLQRSIPKDIEISMRLGEGLPHIKGDPSQLQQVIINLVVNARDAMPSGGRLFIETSAVHGENSLAGAMHKEKGEFVRLSVMDTGEGIDTATQRKIFDPFFTTKDLGKGTGLGLYIVHSIITSHGGYINLYSEPSKGTQFTIYLPVSKDAGFEESYDIEDFKGSATILVIDDEPDVRELCKDLLEPLGYSVVLAGSGSAGIAIFREMKDKISLVILDMIMPQMSGNEVFPVLCTIKPEVKVLLCSGYSQNGFAGINDLLTKGAVGFVQKPFTRQNIALAIKKALLDAGGPQSLA